MLKLEAKKDNLVYRLQEKEESLSKTNNVEKQHKM